MPTPTNPQPPPQPQSQSQLQPQPQPLIWINGFPGTGKLTVATILLQKLLLLSHSTSRKAADDDDDAILLHNHLLIDPVEAIIPRDHPDYQKERKRYRQRIFEQFVHDKTRLGRGRGRVVIFTDYQTDNALGRAVATEYRDAARQAGRPFLPIYLTCDVEENVRRIASRARKIEIKNSVKLNGRNGNGNGNGGTKTGGKLTDVDLLRDFRSRCQLFQFDGGDCGSGWTIDTTDISPEEAAERILAVVREVTEFTEFTECEKKKKNGRK